MHRITKLAIIGFYSNHAWKNAKYCYTLYQKRYKIRERVLLLVCCLCWVFAESDRWNDIYRKHCSPLPISRNVSCWQVSVESPALELPLPKVTLPHHIWSFNFLLCPVLLPSLPCGIYPQFTPQYFLQTNLYLRFLFSGNPTWGKVIIYKVC